MLLNKKSGNKDLLKNFKIHHNLIEILMEKTCPHPYSHLQL